MTVISPNTFPASIRQWLELARKTTFPIEHWASLWIYVIAYHGDLGNFQNRENFGVSANSGRAVKLRADLMYNFE